MSVVATPNFAAEDRVATLRSELLWPMGVDGVYARSGAYEQVVDGLAAYIAQNREPDTEVYRFPPVMSRGMLERSGYLGSFPHLLGCVSCLQGSEAEICEAVESSEPGKEWTDRLAPADLVLTPASCYPIYPLAAQRGAVPDGGLRFDVGADCFRHEPSRNIDRMQSFRMREFVCIGTPGEVAEFRGRWMARITAMARQLHLPSRIDTASDPFFGRGGIFLAKNQVEQSLKFELLISIANAPKPTACMSLNYHRDHFGSVWGLKTADGELAHTSCVAFGMDRLTVALFAAHGLKISDWPSQVRSALRL